MQWLVVRGERSLLLPPGGQALTGPRRRRWSQGRLVEDAAVPAQRTAHGWDFDGAAELDVLVGPETGEQPPAAPDLTVLGSFERFDLSRFLVGGQVVDSRLDVPSEQTALQLWRIAKRQGGAYWDGVAGVVAGWVRGRLGQPHGTLTHTRFVADGVLLLAALGEDRTEVLEPLRVDDWFVHDSEDDGGDRVLNTHLLALLALRANGYDDPRGVGQLHRALTRASGPRSWAHAVDLLAGDVAAGFLPRRRAFTGHTHASEVRAARQRNRDRSLVLPGGRTGRDVRDRPAPAYHTVNTADLASYAMATADPLVRGASEAAARYALVSGHWRGLLRDRDPITLLVPSVLWRLGHRHAADRWAARLVQQGWAPALGWPGHLDQPWDLLPAGCL